MPNRPISRRPCDDLLGVLVARLEVVGDRDDLAVDEVAHGVQDVELLVPEIEAIEAADPLAHVPLPLSAE